MAKSILGNDPFNPGAKPGRNGEKRGADGGEKVKSPPAGRATAQGKQSKQARQQPKAEKAKKGHPVEPPSMSPEKPAKQKKQETNEPAPPPHEPTRAETAAEPEPRPAPEPRRQTFTPPAPAEPVYEYGPSIDRPTSLGLRGRAAAGIRRIEEELRLRLVEGHPEQHRHSPPLEFLWQRWRKLAMRDRSEIVDEFGRDPNVAAAVDPVLDFLYKSWFRVEVSGLENVPAEGRALLVANHSGSLPYDAAMMMHAVRKEHAAHRDVRPLVEDFVFHFPYLGTLMNRIGGVRACQENAERLLRNDELVAVFPEGIKGIGKLFAQRYQLQRFGRGGFVKLALSTDAPIIPTAIVGAEEIHPMLTKVTWLAKAMGIPYIPVTPTFPWLGPLGAVPLPTKWYIAFGEPLYWSAEYGPGAASDRILVNKLAEQVRQRIQEMLESLLTARRSVLFG